MDSFNSLTFFAVMLVCMTEKNDEEQLGKYAFAVIAADTILALSIICFECWYNIVDKYYPHILDDSEQGEFIRDAFGEINLDQNIAYIIIIFMGWKGFQVYVYNIPEDEYNYTYLCYAVLLKITMEYIYRMVKHLE